MLKKIVLGCCSLLVLALAAQAQPTVDAASVGNAASYLPAGLPNSGVAQGGMFIVKGQRLGASGTVIANEFPLRTVMNGTSIRVTVGGATRDAIMVYVVAGRTGNLPDQLAAILPSDTPAGDGTLVVSYNGTSPAVPIRVVRNAFGIFTINQAGSGPAVVQNVNSETDRPVNTRGTSARPGQAMILWGTGLGAITAPDGGPPPVGNLTVPVEVFVGGKSANIIYKGRSGCCAGIDQIVFEVPPDAPVGCSVPLAVVAGGVVSNYTSMAIATAGGLCSSPIGYTLRELETAQRSGSLRVGNIELSRTVLKIALGPLAVENKTDTGSAGFENLSLNQLFAAATVTDLAPGACQVFISSAAGLELPMTTGGQVLDAGPVINVTGPQGTKQLTKGQGGTYSATLGGGGGPLGGGLPDFLLPGSYTADNGAGTAQVGPFRATLTLPPALTWNNEAQVSTVNRERGQEMIWSGGDPAGYVYMAGTSASAGGRATAVFMCLAPTSAGRFTVPPHVLLALPVTTGGIDSMGILMMGSTVRSSRFTATGLDVGMFSAGTLTGKNVTYQ